MILPDRGRTWSEIEHELAAFKREDVPWQEGRLPVYVFWLDE